MAKFFVLNKSETSGITYTVSRFYNKEKRHLLIFQNPSYIDVFIQDLKTFNLIPHDRIFFFSSHHNEHDKNLYVDIKTKALLSLLKEDKGIVFATDIHTLNEKVSSLTALRNSSFVLKKNMRFSREKLLEILNKYHYERKNKVESRGEFSIRGGIVDFFPYGEEHPIRIEFWGDIIESIRIFSEETQTTIDKISKKNIFFGNYKTNSDTTLEALLHKRFEILILEEGDISVDLEVDKTILISSFLSPWSHPLLSIDIPPSFFGNLTLFGKELKKLVDEGNAINIFLSTEGLLKRFSEIMDELNIYFSISYMFKEKQGVTLIKGNLSRGLLIKERRIVTFTEKEILGRRKAKPLILSKSKRVRSMKLSEIKEGDYVVHKEYGIGIYRGLFTIPTEEGEKEYLVIEYRNGDKLYLSPQKLYLIKRYVGATPTINKLKGGEWKRVKERVRKETQEIAKRLYELYMERSKKKGFAFSPDTLWQRELELSFPYNETEDQIRAMEDVKRDMERDVPMERIVCGDVGYGKTEIAVRAAFKAVESGKQVAFLVPTTILASQHFETFKERLTPFPVRIEVLSRFKSQKEQKKIIKALERGEIDVIIGTHRILQSDVKFRDLGLLIIDEEQRFGVMHKERLKELKKDVDVLVLTATPIPRTLYMALTGIRDLSLITTPPENRMPIKTFVYKKSNKIIKEAILNELNRGGQIFYVHNRIRDLLGIKANLEALIPELRVVIAHGQMESDKLEEILIDFWEGKFDVLLTTTIIEIGIDFPNVNTIIIDDSYRYGLSQLYQLRGRVGRSHRKAYAYLLYPSYEKLTGNSKKRLEAIFEYQELGSGFNLALRDLEIRGAGSILGKSQHGYNDVGMELYAEFIREEIEDLKGKPIPNEREFDLGIDYYIPSDYIYSAEERMYYYRQFTSLKTEEELKKLKEELIDRFGRYKKEVKRIFDLVSLRLKAEKVGFEKITKKNNNLELVKNGKEYKIDITNLNLKELLRLVEDIINKEIGS